MPPIEVTALRPEPSSYASPTSLVWVGWLVSAWSTNSPTRPMPSGLATSSATVREPFAKPKVNDVRPETALEPPAASVSLDRAAEAVIDTPA